MIIRSINEALKGKPFHTIAPEKTLREAALVLRQTDAGALAVMDDAKLVGILCERDIVHRAICEHRPMDGTTVADVMTQNPTLIEATASLASAMKTMIDGGFRHAPVVNNGKPIGMLSMRDIPTEYRLMFERFAEAKAGPQQYERLTSAPLMM